MSATRVIGRPSRSSVAQRGRRGPAWLGAGSLYFSCSLQAGRSCSAAAACRVETRRGWSEPARCFRDCIYQHERFERRALPAGLVTPTRLFWAVVTLRFSAKIFSAHDEEPSRRSVTNLYS
jgi:hypothetical protein